MTRAQSVANWSGIPSLSQLLLAALLRLAAMLVSGAVHSMRMPLSRLPRECHTDVTPDRLPAPRDSNQSEEQPAAAGSQTTIDTSHHESFPGKARSAASRQSRFKRPGGPALQAAALFQQQQKFPGCASLARE
jgi:hypothetical protein